MPRITLKGVEIELLGDPHLGRRFVTGVPLHRRWDRERTVWADFHRSLKAAGGVGAHICLGDLFDRSVVPFNVILKTADAYRRAARRHPETRFLILKGNHDDTRDADFRSALDVLSRLLQPFDNVLVVQGEGQWVELPTPEGDPLRLALLPWHPFTSATAMVQTLIDEMSEEGITAIDAAFGHWDLDAYGQDAHNVIPHGVLHSITTVAYSGHVHLPSVRTMGDLEVNVVGSMQPYAHGEDPTGTLYQTHPLDAVEQALSEDPKRFQDVCLRIEVPPGEAIPDGIECLQLLVKRLDDAEDDEPMVEFERFDVDALFDETFAAHGVPEAIVDQIRARLAEARAEAAEGAQ
ncbi:MAG: metallophosphoesterase [Bradymonadia bacterium]